MGIAAEVRNARKCALCEERKRALPAAAVSGRHDSLGVLPEAAVEVIHQVSTDPGRLSRGWLDRALASGLSDAQYVELIGVIVTAVSIDSFCRGLGLPLNALPEPVVGEPSRRRPPGARLDGAWDPMLAPSRATADDVDLFSGPRTANVLRALSLVPDEMRNLKDLSAAHYLKPEQMGTVRVSRALDRNQMELIAGRVSALNECFY